VAPDLQPKPDVVLTGNWARGEPTAFPGTACANVCSYQVGSIARDL
jgi:hypothetical protein